MRIFFISPHANPLRGAEHPWQPFPCVLLCSAEVNPAPSAGQRGIGRRLRGLLLPTCCAQESGGAGQASPGAPTHLRCCPWIYLLSKVPVVVGSEPGNEWQQGQSQMFPLDDSLDRNCNTPPWGVQKALTKGRQLQLSSEPPRCRPPGFGGRANTAQSGCASPTASLGPCKGSLSFSLVPTARDAGAARRRSSLVTTGCR